MPEKVIDNIPQGLVSGRSATSTTHSGDNVAEAFIDWQFRDGGQAVVKLDQHDQTLSSYILKQIMVATDEIRKCDPQVDEIC